MGEISSFVHSTKIIDIDKMCLCFFVHNHSRDYVTLLKKLQSDNPIFWSLYFSYR